MSSTAASAVLLVRPDHFAHNPETAASNAFQTRPDTSLKSVQRAALAEFEGLVAALRARGVRVEVAAGVPGAPDAVFPNNWVSFHRDGTAVLYPMQSPTRRREVRPELVESLRVRGCCPPGRLVDLRSHTPHGFLEGTGSLVLDRRARLAYACRSPRTDELVTADFARQLDYEPVFFSALDRDGAPVYHTNVVMGIGTGFVVIASEAIRDPDERQRLLDRLLGTGRLLVEIDKNQMHSFAGNLIELRGADGAPYIVLSERARAALRPDQRAALASCAELVPVALDTIETVGGGSARCMIAELAWD